MYFGSKGDWVFRSTAKPGLSQCDSNSDSANECRSASVPSTAYAIKRPPIPIDELANRYLVADPGRVVESVLGTSFEGILIQSVDS